jgi:hypothetical protein
MQKGFMILLSFDRLRCFCIAGMRKNKCSRRLCVDVRRLCVDVRRLCVCMVKY